MASDIKHTVKNSKSLTFSLDIFLKNNYYIKCSTSWASRFIKENNDPEKFFRRTKKLYDLPDEEYLHAYDRDTAYANIALEKGIKIKKYLDSEREYVVLTVPVVEGYKDDFYGSDYGIFDSCEAKCLCCNKEIDFSENWYRNHLLDRENFTLFNLDNKRFEVLCCDCAEESKTKVKYLFDTEIPKFIRNINIRKNKNEL